MEPRKIILLVASLAVALLLLVVAKCGSSSHTQLPDSGHPQRATVTAVTTKAEKSASAKVPATIALARALMATEAQLGISSTPLRAGNGGPILPVRVVIERRCNFGDVDGIIHDMEANSGAELIMTVEPLSGALPGPPLYRVISGAELDQGFEHQFQLRSGDKAKQLALYICTDSSGHHRCAGKPAVATDAILFRGKKTHQNVPGERVPDRIYVFQYLMTNAGSVKTLNSIPTGVKRFDQLKKYARMMGESDAGVDVARGAITVLTPLPLAAQGDTLTMTLPRISLQCDSQRP